MDKPQPNVAKSLTVLSVWHNRRARVKPSLHSIFAQEFVDARYLVVDDGSTDGTAEALDSVADSFSDRDIEVIHQPNEGFSRAMTRWTRRITSPYFALHGAGDVSAPNRLAAQLAHAEQTGAVVVGCAVGSIHAEGVCSPLERMPRDFARGTANPDRPPRPGTHGAALIRTDAFREAGGYRSEFRYSQDADLWFRMSALGDFHGVPELMYWKYRGVGETVSSDPLKPFLQALYGELARQCEEDRAAGASDLVERFGPDAVLFLRDTVRLRKRLARAGGQLRGLAAMRGVFPEEQTSQGESAVPRASAFLRRLMSVLP